MDFLKGKTLLIGRDSDGQGRLCVALAVGGQIKMSKLGAGLPVPNSVSRCLPKESSGHIKLEVDPSGRIAVTNLKAANVTFVNGSQIMSKVVKDTDRIELGNDHYPLDLNQVFVAARKMVISGGGSVSTFNIKHLEGVWNQYTKVEKSINEEAKRTALLGRIPLFFSMFSGMLSALSGVLGFSKEVTGVCILLTILGFALFAYSLYRSKVDKTQEKREKNVEWLQEHYLCPNPSCRKFVGANRYKMLKNLTGMRCPHCKCNWVE